MESSEATSEVTRSEVMSEEMNVVCSFFMKTGMCKYGDVCKWTHPLDRKSVDARTVRMSADVEATRRNQQKSQASVFPHRPNAAPCAYFMKTKQCKFGQECMFDHPYGVLLPQRLGAAQCAPYLQTGECKYGATCRYHHPVMSTIDFLRSHQPPPPLPAAPSMDFTSVLQIANAALTSLLLQQHVGASLVAQTPPPYAPHVQHTPRPPQSLPVRPAVPECAFWTQSGFCGYGMKCKFSHSQSARGATNRK